VIDLNCDAGESFGHWTLGDDAALIPHVTSVNIACGFHAGDPAVIRCTVELARHNDVAVGAHPGYPDLPGFGRRAMDLSPQEIEDAVLYQIGAVSAFARAAGVPLTHVKPHGALYNRAARDDVVAGAIARAVVHFGDDLILVGLAGSALISAGRSAGLQVAREGFADRAYEPDGSLRSRTLDGAVLYDTGAIVAQAIKLARDGRVRTTDGELRLEIDTICLHGDTPGAARLAQALRDGLERAGVPVRPLPDVVGRAR
jgi:5-oxoprolinase (ATP-hydrolysing) subunit A